MENAKEKSIPAKAGKSHKPQATSIFKNEDDIFSEILKRHRHDKSFFIDMAEKAGIYDASGNLKSSYRR
ncbi:MAG: hypothetical protein U9R27_03660 [Campylobacterota bacterium]|nr:hypothetical protein [Campylobacterota bacterium]